MSDSVHVWVYLQVYIVSLPVPVPVELCYPHAPACPLWLTGVAGVLLSCCLELIWRAGGVFSQTDCLIPACVEGGRDRHPRVCLFKPLLLSFFLPPSIKCNVKNLGSPAKRGKGSFRDIRLQKVNVWVMVKWKAVAALFCCCGSVCMLVSPELARGAACLV